MPTLLRPTLRLFRTALAVFAVYAVATVPSLLPRWGASPAGIGLLFAWLALAAMAWPIARGWVAGRRYWIGLIVTAVVLRAAAFVLMAGREPIGDPAIYVMLGRSLLAGEGLAFADPLTHTTFLTLYPPAYPLLLAALGAPFGLEPVTVWLSNVAIELGVIALVARLGRRVGSAAGGRAAAWLVAVWPTFVLAAPFAQKEPLQILLMLWLMLVLLDARARHGWRDGVRLGIAAGLLALTQPGLAPLPGVLALALAPVVGVRAMMSLAVRGAIVAALVMTPWWVRNALVMGAFVPLTSTGGIGLWIGNNANATGNWMPLPASYHGLPEIEMSRRAAADAWAWIAGHPFDFVRLSAAKLVRTMGLEQFTLVRWAVAHPAGTPALLAALCPLLQGALAAALAAAALLAGRVRRVGGGDVLLWLTLALTAHILVFDLWFEFAERHRYVLMPMLFLIVGAALATVRTPAAGRGRVRGGMGRSGQRAGAVTAAGAAAWAGPTAATMQVVEKSSAARVETIVRRRSVVVAKSVM